MTRSTKQLFIEIEILDRQIAALPDTYGTGKRISALGASKRGKTPERKAEIEEEMQALRIWRKQVDAEFSRLVAQKEALEAELKEALRVEKLDREQAERDRFAQRQNNGAGRNPSARRDTSWRLK